MQRLNRIKMSRCVDRRWVDRLIVGLMGWICDDETVGHVSSGAKSACKTVHATTQNLQAKTACKICMQETAKWLCTVNLHAMKQRDHWELII